MHISVVAAVFLLMGSLVIADDIGCMVDAFPGMPGLWLWLADIAIY